MSKYLLSTVLLLRAEVRRAQNTRPFRKLTGHQSGCEMLHWDSSERALPCHRMQRVSFLDRLFPVRRKLCGSMHTDKIRFHVALDLSRGIGPHLPTGWKRTKALTID